MDLLDEETIDALSKLVGGLELDKIELFCTLNMDEELCKAFKEH